MNHSIHNSVIVIDRHRSDAYLLSEAVLDNGGDAPVRVEHLSSLRTAREWLGRPGPSGAHILGFLLGVHFADGSGLELAAMIRADPRFARTPIAFWTSDTMKPYTDRITKSRFQVFVKPESFDSYKDLIVVLLQAFRGSATPDALRASGAGTRG